MTTVRYEAVDGVATITLDRPASLNSLTPEVMTDLTGALTRVVADGSSARATRGSSGACPRAADRTASSTSRGSQSLSR